MEVCTPAQVSFHLTNGANQPPIVHISFEPTTKSWQYIVADPSTKKCVIVDPVRDHTNEEVTISIKAADALLAVVHANQYIVDLILETGSGPADEARSAAWYLRMQLIARQGFPPHISTAVGGTTVNALERLFERKYGSNRRLLSNHHDVFAATGYTVVGRMRIQAVPIPGARTPRRRMYIVGGYVFGAHSLAICEKNDSELDALPSAFAPAHSRTVDSVQESPTHRALDVQLFTSMMRVLSLPASSRLYFDCSSPGKHAAAAPGVDGAASEAFETVEQCQNANKYLGLNEQEFAIRRAGERKAAAQTVAVFPAKKTNGKKIVMAHHNSSSSWTSAAISNR